MPEDRTTALRALALSYLSDAADAAPNGRVAHVGLASTETPAGTRLATIGALADAMGARIRQRPASALLAHGVGAYAVARPSGPEHVSPQAPRAAGYAPDRLVIDPTSRTFRHIVGAGVPEHVDDEPTRKLPAG